MAKQNLVKKNVLPMPKAEDQTAGIPRSLGIASQGVNTGGQFAALMSMLMSDLIDGRITPSVGNAVCNAGGKLLKVVEMQQRWGTAKADGGPRDLALTAGVKKVG
jgi:hypothetical protein